MAEFSLWRGALYAQKYLHPFCNVRAAAGDADELILSGSVLIERRAYVWLLDRYHTLTKNCTEKKPAAS